LKYAVLCKNNVTVLKVGFTKEELLKIIDGNPKEIVFDKFHTHEYHVIIKRLKSDVEKK
jgi:hypothetical protein